MRVSAVAAALAPPHGIALQVESIVLLVAKGGLVQVDPWLVGKGPALVHTERGAVAALVAKVVHVEDLPALLLPRVVFRRVQYREFLHLCCEPVKKTNVHMWSNDV